jgi:predicted DNA-binding protein (UPF0251 family)
VISIDTLRKIDPETLNLKDEELEKIRLSFYEFGQLMFEDWQEQKFGSKNPIGSLTTEE